MSSGMKERLCRSLEKVLHAETRELPAAAGGILLFFLLFLAYSMLRPVRETMGIAGDWMVPVVDRRRQKGAATTIDVHKDWLHFIPFFQRCRQSLRQTPATPNQ